MASPPDTPAPAPDPAFPGPGRTVSEPGPAPEPTATAEFGVAGMHCGACVLLIEEVLADRAGVRSAAVDLESGRATVDYDPSRLGVDELRATIEEAGYPATPVG